MSEASSLGHAGRLRGYRARDFVVLACASFAGFSSLYLLLAALPLYFQSLGLGGWQIGLLVGASSISATLMTIVMGRLIDRFGRKRFLLLGALASVTSALLYIGIKGFLPLLLVRLVHGLLPAAFITAAFALVGDLVPEARRGWAIGTYGMFGTLAHTIAPAIGVAIAQYSYRALFVTCAVAATVAFLLGASVREPRLAPAPPGAPTGFQRRWLSPLFVAGACSVSYGALVTFLPLFAVQRGMGNPGLFFGIQAATVFALRAFGGRLSDNWGRFRVAAPGAGFMVLGLLAVIIAQTIVGMIAGAILYGIGAALVYPALSALVLEGSHSRNRGTAAASYNVGFGLGIAIGSVGGGVAVTVGALVAPRMSANLWPLVMAAVFVSAATLVASLSVRGELLRRANPKATLS
ncbi:MAG: MFS transporter [Candidatus Dormibacteria bacterium]